MMSAAFLHLFILSSAVWFILRKVTLRTSPFQVQVQQQKKGHCVCPGKVLIKVCSDWTSSGSDRTLSTNHIWQRDAVT